jgi:hypothetical protein
VVVVVVVFVGECDFSRTSRKGRIFYIHKLADKRFSTCSLSVEDNAVILLDWRQFGVAWLIWIAMVVDPLD